MIPPALELEACEFDCKERRVPIDRMDEVGEDVGELLLLALVLLLLTDGRLSSSRCEGDMEGVVMDVRCEKQLRTMKPKWDSKKRWAAVTTRVTHSNPAMNRRGSPPDNRGDAGGMIRGINDMYVGEEGVYYKCFIRQLD